MKMNKTVVMSLLFLLAAVAALQVGEGSADVETVKFQGLGLNCAECPDRVKGALDKILGIEEYQIDAARDSVTVTFVKDVMEAEWIMKSLDAAGFPPETMQKMDYSEKR